MHVVSQAVILFVDIRGFSLFCEHVNVTQGLEDFLGTCYKHILTIFNGAYIKPLGDGAMIIQECSIPQSVEDVGTLLSGVLTQICRFEVLFRETCQSFGTARGEEAHLSLGWGVTRGLVILLEPAVEQGITDRVGVDINKAAKLCKEARPAGVIIDYVDFPLEPVFPSDSAYQAFPGMLRPFVRSEYTVHGLREPIPVWASLAPESQPEP